MSGVKKTNVWKTLAKQAPVGLFMSVLSINGIAVADINRNAPSKDMGAEIRQLLEKAQQAMKDGRPEVAVIYLKNAEATGSQYMNVHLALGEALLASGNPAEAMRELTIAKDKGGAPEKVLPPMFRALLAQRQAQLLLNQFPAPADGDHSAVALATLQARAQALAQLGKNAEATAVLDKALAFDHSSQTILSKAQIALTMGDVPLASSLVDQVLKIDADNINALLLRVGLSQKANQPDKALPYASKLISNTRGSPIALVARAGLYLQMHRDELATADVDAALKTAPGFAQAVYYKALIRARAKDTVGAWELAQTLPREFLSSTPEIGVSTSQMAFGAGHKDIATDILHSTVHSFPDHTDARIRLAAAYIALNDLSNASLTLAPVANSKDPRVLALTAQVYAKRGDKAQAQKYLSLAAEQGFGGDAVKLQLVGDELRNGDVDKAEANLAQLNSKNPGATNIAGLLVELRLNKGNVAGALDVANRLQAANPKSAFGPMLKAQIKRRQGDTDGGIFLYSQALTLDPKNLPSLLGRSAAYSTQGKLQDALKDAQSAMAIDKKNAIPAVRVAQLQAQMGQAENAIETVKQARTLSPDDPGLLIALAQLYIGKHDFGAAQSLVAAYCASHPKNASTLALLGNIQLGKGDKAGAIATYNKLIAVAPKSANGHILLARAYAINHDQKSVNREFDAALAVEPKDQATWASRLDYDLSVNDLAAALGHAQAFYTAAPGPASAQALALAMARSGKVDAARHLLEENLSKNPNSRSLIQLSTLLRSQSKTAESDKIMRTWIEQHPSDNVVKQAYAVTLIDRNNVEAEKLLRQVLAVTPYDVATLNNLAWVLREKDPKAALGFASRAADVDRASPSVKDTLGWIKWQVHDGKGAIALLKVAQAATPQDPEVNFHLGSVMIGMGDKDGGRKMLAAALASKASFTDRKLAEAALNAASRK